MFQPCWRLPKICTAFVTSDLYTWEAVGGEVCGAAKPGIKFLYSKDSGKGSEVIQVIAGNVIHNRPVYLVVAVNHDIAKTD